MPGSRKEFSAYIINFDIPVGRSIECQRPMTIRKVLVDWQYISVGQYVLQGFFMKSIWNILM